MAKNKDSASSKKPAETREQAPAEYTVVARRYRPQQFADLIGQEHVASALTNAITSGRIAHAYLFTGARGVGKTSCARILAKALNCEQGPTPTPCDKCDNCRSIANGEDMDAVEIDGASNNKVDEARELRSNVGFRPQRARYKIYIIDEVHMLSTGAFNALLKTLEEPPPHVKFIFATTEVQKLPITILSRCQRFDFASVGPKKVFETLKHIVGKEGLRAEDAALQIIARRAAGSMRDSQTLLDQLLGYCDGDLTAEKVHSLLGTAGDERIADLADAILTHDARRAVELVGEAAERGLQLGELLDQLVDYWRGLMLMLVAGDDVPGFSGTPALHDRLSQHAKAATLDTILSGLDILTTTKSKLRGSPHVQVLLEVAVVRLSRLEELLSVSQIAQMVASGASITVPNGVKPAIPARPNTPPVNRSGAKENAPEDVTKKNAQPAPKSLNGKVSEATELSEEVWPNTWGKVLQEVGLIRAEQLKFAGLPAIFTPNTLSIRFPAQYSAAYDFCASESGQETIRNSLKKVTGKDWQLRFEKVADASANGTELAPVRRDQRRKDLLELPLFKKAADVLGAQLVKADPGFDPQSGTVEETHATVPHDDEV